MKIFYIIYKNSNVLTMCKSIWLIQFNINRIFLFQPVIPSAMQYDEYWSATEKVGVTEFGVLDTGCDLL